MDYTMDQYRASAQAIRDRLGDFVPKVAMVLGSGLGYLGDEVENAIAIDYQDIPHFKASTAPGHKGRLVFGMLEGQRVAVMQGRMHHYEGYSYEAVSYAVRALRLLGCDTLIVTNAAGCVNTDWKAGDLMLITDQIKMFSDSPLRGENLPDFGVRFPDASHLYTVRLQELARETAKERGIPLREGVYFYCYGPQYETPAEIRAVRLLGGEYVLPTWPPASWTSPSVSRKSSMPLPPPGRNSPGWLGRAWGRCKKSPVEREKSPFGKGLSAEG